MTTSTQQITDLIAGYSNLKAYFEGIQTDIDIRLNSVADRWESGEAVFYVDQATGSDTADGTQVAPLASFQEAISRTPLLSKATIYFRGDYTINQLLSSEGRTINVLGCAADWSSPPNDALRPSFRFGFALTGNNEIQIMGFEPEGAGAWDLARCRIAWPSLADIQTTYPAGIAGGGVTGLFRQFGSGSGSPGWINLRYLNIDLPADPVGWLFAGTRGFGLYFYEVTWSASRDGLIHPDATAGLTANQVAHLMTINVATL